MSCSARSGCHSLGGGNDVEVTVVNSLEARPGDTVSLVLSSGRILAGAWFVYLTPVAALFSGTFLGQALSGRLGIDPETASVAAGFGFLALGLLVVRILGRRMGEGGKFTPKMGRIVRRGPEGPGKCAGRPEST